MTNSAQNISAPPVSFRFDFPPEVAAEREQVFVAILKLMTEATQESVTEACRMQTSWLKRYPNDYAMLDLGGSLWMLADTFKAAAASEPAPALLAR